MKNTGFVVIIVIAIILALIVLFCLYNKSENFRIRRIGGGWRHRPFRRRSWRRRWTRPYWSYPYYGGSYVIYNNTPNNYGNCKCKDGKSVEDNCQYGHPFCSGENCICGKGEYWGCDSRQNEWCN